MSDLRDLGFLVVRQALDRETVELLRSAFDGALPATTEHVEITDATPHVDLWRELIDREPVRSLSTAAFGIAQAVNIHGRNPGRGAGEQGLHADLPADPVGALSALTILWMLDDFTADNGATRIVPGTHLRRTLVPRDFAQPDRHHPDEVIVTGSAGDIVIFDAHLWHSGRRNSTSSPRRAVQMTVTAAG